MAGKKLGVLTTGVEHMEGAPEFSKAGVWFRLERAGGGLGEGGWIAVLGRGGVRVGRVPEKTAGWLGPLLDRGWIEVRGRAVGGRSPGDGTVMELTVTLTPKGEHLLAMPEEPRTPAEELHAQVLQFWPPAWRDGPLARSRVWMEMTAGSPCAMLPETRLLLEISPPSRRKRGKGVRKPKGNETRASLADMVEALEIGRPVSAGQLAVFPVASSVGGSCGVVSFDRASAEGMVEIKEISAGGSVNSLKVTNTGTAPVLLPQGLVVVGGKQDRMIAIAVVVAPGSTRKVPVNCVEAGRWHWESGVLSARRMATPSVRRRVVSRRKAEVAGLQGEVWKQVGTLQRSLGVYSSTGALEDVYAQMERGDDGVLAQLLEQLPDNICGLMAAAGGRLLGCDIFGTCELFEPMRERLIEAWLVEARMAPGGEGGALGIQGLRRILLDAVNSARPERYGQNNGVTRLVLDTGHVTGSILLYGEKLLHMAMISVN